MANHEGRGGRHAPNKSPTPKEVQRAQESAGRGDAWCAEACCVSEATWRQWKAGEKVMPGGAWKLFRILIGWLPAA
jgi:DNA-binding transcriptional regulator YiaG